jgi:tRNA threonylcarbamoyl adenosine modification protein YeaZ
MSTKPILAFDCATTSGSVALMLDGKISQRPIAATQQAAELVGTIDALMQAQSVAYEALGAIITTIGPGSFTGVRIGLAALHGFVLVAPVPIKLLTTLEALAWDVASRADAPTDFYIAIRAGKGEVYAQRFRLQEGAPRAEDDIALHPEAKADWEHPCYGNAISAEDARYIAMPDAGLLCRIAERVNESTLADAMPLYIRPPDAIIPTTPAWFSVN